MTEKKTKTFPVPISLGELNKNITLNSNSLTENSIRDLINNALKFHSQGNILKAATSYQYLIDLGISNYLVFSNYGTILKDLGKLNQAEIMTRKSIQIKPDFFQAHLNLGSILIDLGQLHEAEMFTRKAIQFKPKLADAHNNLGIILYSLGRLNAAEKSTREAIKIQPMFPEALANLGGILIDLGKLKEAEIFTRKAIRLKPNYINAHLKLGEILFELDKPEEASNEEWNAIKLNPLFKSLKSYRKDAKIINKTAFYVYSYSIFNHYKSIIEINPNSFELLVPDNIDQKIIIKIRNIFKEINLKIRKHSDLIEKKLIYNKLISNTAAEEKQFNYTKNNIQQRGMVPAIKLLGHKNIRFMYTAGKNKNTFSYWNKYYDGILCFGPYHEKKFKLKHQLATSQMGYPRFDKYFNPGFERDYLLKKFKCDPRKKTIVWITTWSNLSSIDKYLKEVSSLKSDHNIVVRPHPTMKVNAPESHKNLFSEDFTYIDDNEDDNVPLYALADLMLFDYGGSMFGSLYLNKNFAFLEMDLEAKNHFYLGQKSSEDYIKSFFPKRVANLDNLKSICNYCLKNPPSNSVLKTLREEFFNTNFQGNSSKRAYELLISDEWLI